MDLIMENELYELAEKVHSSKRSPPNLKALCLDLVVQNHETWIALNKQLEINVFEKMGKQELFL